MTNVQPHTAPAEPIAPIDAANPDPGAASPDHHAPRTADERIEPPERMRVGRDQRFRQVERLRVKLGQAPPVPERPGVERHQVRQAKLHLVHGEADHAQGATGRQEAERSFLTGAGTVPSTGRSLYSVASSVR